MSSSVNGWESKFQDQTPFCVYLSCLWLVEEVYSIRQFWITLFDPNFAQKRGDFSLCIIYCLRLLLIHSWFWNKQSFHHCPSENFPDCPPLTHNTSGSTFFESQGSCDSRKVSFDMPAVTFQVTLSLVWDRGSLWFSLRLNSGIYANRLRPANNCRVNWAQGSGAIFPPLNSIAPLHSLQFSSRSELFNYQNFSVLV